MGRFVILALTFPTVFCVRMYQSVKGKLAKLISLLFSFEDFLSPEKAILLTALEKLSVEII